MTRCGIALAILISVLMSSSAWAVPQGASCRSGARPQNHTAGITLLCWGSPDPWQDCAKDPWQLSAWVSSQDAFADPWQDSEDPWQPFGAESIARTPARSRSAVSYDAWQTMHVRAVKLSSVTAVRDSVEDPWQPAFADPWQDYVEDPWQ